MIKNKDAPLQYGQHAKNGAKIVKIKKGKLCDNNKPLIVLDGKIVRHDILDSYNVELIESIKVIKNENTIALYGKHGKNGVIIVNTKKASRLKMNNKIKQ